MQVSRGRTGDHRPWLAGDKWYDHGRTPHDVDRRLGSDGSNRNDWGGLPTDRINAAGLRHNGQFLSAKSIFIVTMVTSNKNLDVPVMSH